MKTLSRKKLLLVFMLVFVGTAQLGYYIPVSDDDANLFMEQFMSQLGEIDSIGIAIHNLTIATGMFIPGVGSIFGVVTAIQTGFAFNVANTINDMPFEIPPIVVLALTPFGIMEWVAYGIGMSRSWILVMELNFARKVEPRARNEVLKRNIKPALIEYGIVVALLTAGGFIEYWMIQNMGTLSEMIGGFG